MTQIARKLRTPEDVDRFRAALINVDQAFWVSEQKYGVGRLERLVSPATLASYRRGWDAYRLALDEGDPDAVETIGPKMIAALAYMDQEASAAGHAPLAPDTWEAPMTDGTVLCVVRSVAEASHVIRGARVTQATGRSMLGMAVTAGEPSTPPEMPSSETTLPVDLAVTIRHQHEGRRLEVWSLPEIVLLIEKYGSVVERAPGKKWEGDATHSGVQQHEMMAYDLTRSGYPLSAPLAF